MIQSLATVVLPFAAECEGRVNDALAGLGDRNGTPYAQVAQRLAASDNGQFVHFMSMVVIPASGAPLAHLVIELSADGHAPDALARLARAIPDVLLQVIRETGTPLPQPEGLGDYLCERCHLPGPGLLDWTPGLMFSGTPDMSVERILDERRLATRIRELLNEAPSGSAYTSLRFVRSRIFEEVDYKWAFVPEPIAKIVGPALSDQEPGSPAYWLSAISLVLRVFLWPMFMPPVLIFMYYLARDVDFERWLQGLRFAADFHLLTLDWWLISIGAFFDAVWQTLSSAAKNLLPAILAFIATLAGVATLVGAAIGLAYMRLRQQEKRDVPLDLEPPESSMSEIQAYEDRAGVLQNHLAAVSIVKPGIVRRATLRLALAIVAEAARVSKPGFVNKIGSIHFARWLRLPGTDKLVFFSNYDGSWQSYLEDFIARLRAGLTSIWSNTRNFPKTVRLVEMGAADGARFKRWARCQQIPTRFWYTAYPTLTTDRIRTNALIRHGFARASNEREASEWLANIGHLGRESLETPEIPTLAFGGLSKLPYAHCFLVRFDSGRSARTWLGAARPLITYGDRMPAQHAVVAGFTADGLEKLGLNDRSLATFPMAFQQGMSHPARARALGDDPDAWRWSERRTDAVVLVYAETRARLDEGIREMQATFPPDLECVQIRIKDVQRGNTTEAFDFRDGISQPVMRGTLRASHESERANVVQPGEMVLGYQDNLGVVAPTPQAYGYDIGRNGTFLVIRQLEQHKRAFLEYLARTAAALDGDKRVPSHGPEFLAEWLAAKMMGRWRDGTSLVRHPNMSGSASEAEKARAEGRPPREISPDNSFMFGREDPDGVRCPFGAHVRRANPRDSFEPSSQMQLDISNRHRILRIGRSYVPDEGADPGLLFMCVNADIERQFEFLQQSWILGPNFHGLHDEIDPIVGCATGGAPRSMSIPTPNGPIQLPPLADFVTVLGGAYFFMPSRSAVDMLLRLAPDGADEVDAVEAEEA